MELRDGNWKVVERLWQRWTSRSKSLRATGRVFISRDSPRAETAVGIWRRNIRIGLQPSSLFADSSRSSKAAPAACNIRLLRRPRLPIRMHSLPSAFQHFPSGYSMAMRISLYRSRNRVRWPPPSKELASMSSTPSFPALTTTPGIRPTNAPIWSNGCLSSGDIESGRDRKAGETPVLHKRRDYARRHIPQHNNRSIHDRLQDRRRWHGRSLSGEGHETRTQSRPKDSAFRRRVESRSDGPLRARSEVCRGAESSQHRANLRDRRGRGHAIHCYGVHRWRDYAREDSPGANRIG